MARDGHWFFFETKTDAGRSFEFFGIVPDSAGNLPSKTEITIPGKLLRLTNGEVTGNVDATYIAPVCVLE
jgi:hypothetical protein